MGVGRHRPRARTPSPGGQGARGRRDGRGTGIGIGIGIGIGTGRSMGGWRDMPAEALEEQYSPSRWSPRLGRDTIIQAHLAVTAAGTQRARAGTRTSLHVPYGDGEGEKLDIYFPADPSGTFPVLVYIHGGYWQCLRGIYLCGHSAGAHLAAMVLSTDWTEYGVAPDIKGAVLVSGVYDLEPILHTYVNDVLNMSREVAQRNSPMLCISPAVPAAAACEVLVAVAQHDSPEFRRQSQEYGQALRAAGWSVSLLDLAGVDHFDIIEKLAEDSYVLTQAHLWAAMMSLLRSQERSTLGRKHPAQPQDCQNRFILCPDHPLGPVSLLQHPCTRVVHMGHVQCVAFGTGDVWLCFWVLSAGPELEEQSFCRGLEGALRTHFLGD
ncbi:kynurenine formamidase isoform X2 [Haliaeetus albicilla]|uniref:kynurenine formamidase isoform X2 n=1 Tax=Haliaeetus albicilla TaxID=8969 RepID=UPI0037E85E87